VITLTKEVRDEIAADLLKTRAPSRTAKNLGYSIQLVLEVAEEESRPRSRYTERFGGLGRPELARYTVARKRVWDLGWDNKSGSISKARADYEAGTHEMATGRDGEWLILYSIPRTKVEPRPNYFLPEAAL